MASTRSTAQSPNQSAEGPRNILVTNDDGIDSVGLHVLARAMKPFGNVTIVAPDSEYSGAGAAIGALHLAETEVQRVEVEGIDASWTINGPPGLCVFYARMGAFEFVPDLIVSGINPGANLGRSVYHSGTIGAALTGRNGGVPGIAVSQKFPTLDVQAGEPGTDGSKEEPDYAELVAGQIWESAAAVAAEVVAGMLASELDDVGVLNLNVPNLPIDEIKGWAWAEVGLRPPWAMTEAKLVPKENKAGYFEVETAWSEQQDQPPGTDSAVVLDDRVSVTWLSRITAVDQPAPRVDEKLNNLFG